MCKSWKRDQAPSFHYYSFWLPFMWPPFPFIYKKHELPPNFWDQDFFCYDSTSSQGVTMSLMYFQVLSSRGQQALGQWALGLDLQRFTEFILSKSCSPCMPARSKSSPCCWVLGLLISTRGSSNCSTDNVWSILAWACCPCPLGWALLSLVSSLAAWRAGVKPEGPSYSSRRMFLPVSSQKKGLHGPVTQLMFRFPEAHHMGAVMPYTRFRVGLTRQNTFGCTLLWK